MENQVKTKLAFLYVSLVVLLWASTVAVAKLVLRGITNIQLTFYIYLFAVIALFVVVVIQGKLKILRGYSKRDYFHMAYMGALGCYLYSMFLYGALTYAPAQEVIIVNNLWPMMVVVFAVLILKEKLTVKKIVGLILSFTGVYVVMTQGDLFAFTFTNAKGDILALLGAVSYGVFSVLGKKHSYEKFTSIFLYYCFGLIFITITVLIFSSIPKVSFGQLVGLGWLGVMLHAFGFIFWFKALEYGDTAKMANIVFLTPFLSLVYVYFLIGEHILTSSVIGLISIIAGIVIQSLRSRTSA